MKWNIEWVDLQIIEHMVAECWRMGGYQLEKYVQKLSKQQELIFAGELGLKFLGLLQKSIDEEKALDWAKLQKDIHLMQELIQDGQAQHDLYWKGQYQELTADPAAYFSTEFGIAFTEQIAAKLELGISEEQRMLQHDIVKIQKICSSCNWDDEEKAKKALFLLTRDEKYYFSSWLGDAFINVLQERYGKKEAEEESEFKIQPEAAAVKKSSFKTKMAWTLFICISVGIVGFLFYMQSDGGRGKEKLQNLLSDMMSSVNTDQTGIAENQDEEPKTLNLQSMLGSQGIQNQNENGADAFIGQARTEEQQPEPTGNGAESASGTELPDGQSTDEAGSLDTDEADNQSTDMTDDQGTGMADDWNVHILDKNTADTGMEDDQRAAVVPDILPQYQSFYKRYPDLFGWLKISGTQIDHPVMQSDDEVRGERYYYLHRDYTGQQSEAGSLFVENASSCYPQDGNTVIYGHNMSNGLNFGILEQYKDAEFYRNHPLIQYDTIYETGTYQIVAVLITRILYQDEEGFRYYRFYNYHTEQEFQECTDFVKENQLYDTGEQLQYGDQLLMLSTCEYSKPNGRLVIAAKKVG